MAKSKPKPKPLRAVPSSTPSPDPLNDALIDLDHAVDEDTTGAGASIQNRDELYPCIFHLYFGVCENVDCGFSHSTKALASCPPSRPTSPLSDRSSPRTPFKKTTSKPRGGGPSQPCRNFIKGNCKYGDRCNYLHERPKTKSDLPWRSTSGRTGGATAPEPPPKPLGSPKKMTLESNTTAAITVVPKVEVRVARNEEFFDDVGDDRNDNNVHAETNLNQPESPYLEYASLPPDQNTSLPQAPSSHSNTSGHDVSMADSVSPHDPNPSYADGWDGVDVDPRDDYNPGTSLDNPDASENDATNQPGEEELGEGDSGGGHHKHDYEDKWGWNEDPRAKKEEKAIIVTQDEWSFKSMKRKEVDIEVDGPEHAPPKENLTTEKKREIDPAWSQVPDDERVEKVQREPGNQLYVRDNWEDDSDEFHPVVDETRDVQDSTPNQEEEFDGSYQAHDSEGAEGPDAGHKRHHVEYPADEPAEGLDVDDEPRSVQRPASELARELDAGDELHDVQHLSLHLAEEPNVASEPHDGQPAFEAEDESSLVETSRNVDAQHRTRVSHSSLRPSIRARSSIGSMRATGAAISDTTARPVPRPAAVSILPPVLSAPIPPAPVPVPVPPSLPTPIPTSDARQTSMMSLHWCRFADPTIDPAIAFCKAFAQNKCSNMASDTCVFRHCLTPQEYTLLFKDPQPLQFSLQKNLIRNDSPANMTLITSPSFTLHWSHFADPTCDPQVAFCKPYAEHMCPHDVACIYRHCLTLEEYTLLFKDPQPNLIATGSAARGQPATTPQQGSSSQRRVPCIYFKKGGCKNGSSCPWLHECPNIQSNGSCNDASCSFCSSTPETMDQAHPRTSQKPCSFWPKGTCKYGDQCPYAHIGESGAASASGGGEANYGGREGDTAGDNQGDQWGASGDANAWDNANDGNLGDGNVNEGGDSGLEVNNDQNQVTGWGDQNDTSGGWGIQNNVGGNRGDQVNDSSGWEDQKNDTSGSGNQKNDTSGWGNQQHGDISWGNQKNDADDWMNLNINQSDSRGQNNDYGVQRRENRSNNRGDNAHYGDKRRNRDERYTNGTNGMKKQSVCYPFRREGRCRWGPDCRYSHDLEQGGSSGHGSRDAPKPRQPRTPSTPTLDPATQDPVPETPAHRAPSTYGGRGHYDRDFIDEWKREVAASEVASEAGGSQATGRYRGSNTQTDFRGHTNDKNRLVERPPTGDPCQFYLVGRCTIGDICPSSHDPVVPEIGDKEGTDGVDGLGVSVGKARQLEREERSRRERYDSSSSSKVKDRTRNDDIRVNHVVDSKWGHDDQWDDVPVRVPEEEIQIDKPCLFFGQGFCRAGDLCRFIHVEPEQPSPERSVKDQQLVNQEGEGQKDASEPGTRDHVSDVDPQMEVKERDYGHPLVERSIFGCAVVFGRDCLPDEVTTGTDSHTLILEGPPGISEARVHDYVHKYGPIKDIIITPEAPAAVEGNEDDEQEEEENALRRSAIRIEFKDMRDAATAARSLRERGASLADAIPIEPANTTSAWVRFRWPQVTRAAWIHYSSITEAKMMAEKLHGSLFQERKITASFLRPDKRQKDLYAIKLERLPVDTTRGDLADISQDSRLITISELTYTEDPREVLQQSAGVKAFVNIPEKPAKISAVAFACLDSEDSISRALQMHGTKPKFIGKQELTVERVWFAHYGLPANAFKSVSTEVAALQIQYEGRAQVESSDFGDHHMIYLHAPHEETETFVQANLSLQVICHGMVVTAPDNQPEWDDYFYSASSIKVVENLNSKNSFYIFPNPSTRQIHVFGCGVDQDKGISTVKKLLQKVRGSCQEYPIHRNVLRRLIDGGLTELQADVGVNKLSLDVLRSVLVVRGGDAVLMQKIRHLLDFSPSGENDEKFNCSRALCSVCELQPGGGESNPIVKLFCGHVYCGACLKNALISAAQNHSGPVKCIGRGPPDDLERNGNVCGRSIAYTTARDLLPLLLEPDYLKATFLTFIHSNLDEFFFCPSVQCDAVYRRGEPESIIRCPTCRAWLCLFCGSMSHDGVACEQAKEIRANTRR